MKRIALVMALVAMAGCSKGEEKPAASTPAASTPAADTSKMMMSDTSKKMMMSDTSKKMTAPPAKPMAPADKKKKP